MNNTTDLLRTVVSCVTALALSACTVTPEQPGLALDPAADPFTNLAILEAAVQSSPRDPELRTDYLRQREGMIVGLLAAADQAVANADFERAEQRYRDVLRIDEQHPRARAGLDALIDERRRVARLGEADLALSRGDLNTADRLARSVLAEVPAHASARRLLREVDERRLQTYPVETLSGPLAKRVSLSFREAPLRVVFEALSQAAGLNFVLDSDVRDDTLVSLMVRDTSVDDVIRLIAATQQIERKLLNANSVLIYPATPAKQREYQELVSRSFYLAHADVKQAEVMLKQIVKVRDVFIDEKLNLVVIKDTPQAVHLAERLLAALDVAEAEVMLEVEVLEVSRNKLRHLGIEFPDQIGFGVLTEGATGLLVPGFASLRSGTDFVPYVPNPAAVARLRQEDGDTALLANPRIRAKNRTEARVHIGERVPVFTTTTTDFASTSSVEYLDIGLKLDVEPSVTLDDEVAIKIALEVSSIIDEVRGPQESLAYQIGTRSASTELRLRNGETQVLAGLINDQERRSAQRVPGLGDLPVLGPLFSATRNSASQSEIVLLITPRIIRNVTPPVFARDHLPAGTEASVGADALRIGATPNEGLALSGTGALGGQAMPAPLPMPTTFADTSQPLAAPAAEGPPSGVEVEVSAPATAQAGSTMTLTFNLQGSGRHDGAVLEFDYDAGLLEPVGFAGAAAGQGSVVIAAGSLPTSVTVAFQVRPGVTGTASLFVNGVVFEIDGTRTSVPAGGSATVTVVE